MLTTNRLGWLAFLTALAALCLEVNPATAQPRRGISIQSGGSSNSSSSNNQNQNNNNNNNNNNSNDDDDDNQSSGKRSSRSGSSRSGSSSSSSSTSQGIQQGLQVLQGGGNNNQLNNNNNNQGQRSMRRSGGSQQGIVIQGGQSSSSQQVQNFQPWQMWSGNNNNNNNNNRGNNNRGNNNRGQGNQGNSSNWFIQLGGGPSPFSGGWYEKHPHAWHNHSNDAWKVATAASVVGWLGWGTPYTHQVVYQPVSGHTVIFDPNAQGPWMLLGVYTLLTGPSDTGTRTLQLSINQQGYLRGTYYDMITNEVYNVRGRVDQATQYAQWYIDTNRDLTFYTPLYHLTQSQGIVNANLPGGTQQWQVARMELANQ